VLSFRFLLLLQSFLFGVLISIPVLAARPTYELVSFSYSPLVLTSTGDIILDQSSSVLHLNGQNGKEFNYANYPVEYTCPDAYGCLSMGGYSQAGVTELSPKGTFVSSLKKGTGDQNFYLTKNGKIIFDGFASIYEDFPYHDHLNTSIGIEVRGFFSPNEDIFIKQLAYFNSNSKFARHTTHFRILKNSNHAPYDVSPTNWEVIANINIENNLFFHRFSQDQKVFSVMNPYGSRAFDLYSINGVKLNKESIWCDVYTHTEESDLVLSPASNIATLQCNKPLQPYIKVFHLNSGAIDAFTKIELSDAESIETAVISPNGRFIGIKTKLFSPMQDSEAILVDSTTGTVVVTRKIPLDGKIDFSKNGQFVTMGGIIYDLISNREIFTSSKNPSCEMKFNEALNYVYYCEDDHYLKIDLATGQVVGSVQLEGLFSGSTKEIFKHLILPQDKGALFYKRSWRKNEYNVYGYQLF
jgi:hypothetical protein